MIIFGVVWSLLIQIYLSCDDPNIITILQPFEGLRSIQMKVGDEVNIICCHPDGSKYLKWKDSQNKVVETDVSASVFTLKDEKDRLILKFNKVNQDSFGVYTCENNFKNLYKQLNIAEKKGVDRPIPIKKQVLSPKDRPLVLECPIGVRSTFKSWVYTTGGKDKSVNKPGIYEDYEISDNKLQFKIVKNLNNFVKVWCHYQEVSGNGDVKNNYYEFSWMLYDPIDVKLVVSKGDMIKEGANITLTCSYKNNPMQSVRFPVPHRNTFKTKTFPGQAVTEINKITKNMEGKYQCIVTHFLMLPGRGMQPVTEKAEIDLKVLTKPIFQSTSFIERPISIKQDVTLRCEVKALQLDKTQLYFLKFNRQDKSWQRITESQRFQITISSNNDLHTLKLFIKNLEWSDRGKYKCSATNPIGTSEYESGVRVGKPESLYTSISDDSSSGGGDGKSNNIVFIGINPIMVSCIVSGYSAENSRDIVEMRLVNQSTDLRIKQIKRKYDAIDGLQVDFQISHGTSANMGSNYLTECFYQNIKSKRNITQQFIVKAANKPTLPNIELFCAGSSGLVVKVLLPKQTDVNNIIENINVYYAPINDFDIISNKPMRVFPVTNVDRANGHMSLILMNLTPETVYKLKLDANNKYGMSASKEITGKTKALTPPDKPRSIEFFRVKEQIAVNVTWNSSCSYRNVNQAVEEVLIKLKTIDGSNRHFEWIERNFTMNTQQSNSLTFFMAVEGASVDYEVEIAVRSLMGQSEFKTELLQPNKIKAAAVCFPFCGKNTAANLKKWSLASVILHTGLLWSIIKIIGLVF